MIAAEQEREDVAAARAKWIGTMKNLDPASLVQRGNDPPDHFLIRLTHRRKRIQHQDDAAAGSV